ncbi:MAG: hypothetical protein ABI612_26750 [Betaproteobacteria bacterium]
MTIVYFALISPSGQGDLMRILTLAVSVSVLSGCASSPSSISAAYISPTTYQNLTCQQIDTEILAVDSKAGDLYHRIKRRSSSDSVYMGVGLLVAWPALLFLSGGKSNDATEYAQLKGSKDALIAARRSCSEVGGYGPRRTDIPGTVHMGRITLVPAETESGMCIIAPASYRGTGSTSSPVITSGMPRCSSLGQ